MGDRKVVQNTIAEDLERLNEMREHTRKLYEAMVYNPPGYVLTLTDHEYNYVFGPPRFSLPKRLSRKKRKVERAKLIEGWYR